MPVISTPFSIVYDRFLSKITDDMYMELNQEETFNLLHELLENAIPWFEFPRINLDERDQNQFYIPLSNEEINILATYMVVEWLSQQLATIELVRMKYSGSDFKFTSQANHIHKLKDLQKEYERKGFHLQRLYKRRRVDENGVFRSTFGSIMETPNHGTIPYAHAVSLKGLAQDVKDLQELTGNQSNSNPADDREIIIVGGDASSSMEEN